MNWGNPLRHQEKSLSSVKRYSLNIILPILRRQLKNRLSQNLQLWGTAETQVMLKNYQLIQPQQEISILNLKI